LEINRLEDARAPLAEYGAPTGAQSGACPSSCFPSGGSPHESKSRWCPALVGCRFGSTSAATPAVAAIVRATGRSGSRGQRRHRRQCRHPGAPARAAGRDIHPGPPQRPPDGPRSGSPPEQAGGAGAQHRLLRGAARGCHRDRSSQQGHRRARIRRRAREDTVPAVRPTDGRGVRHRGGPDRPAPVCGAVSADPGRTRRRLSHPHAAGHRAGSVQPARPGRSVHQARGSRETACVDGDGHLDRSGTRSSRDQLPDPRRPGGGRHSSAGFPSSRWPSGCACSPYGSGRSRRAAFRRPSA
jgi:hypothetical protein